MARVRGGGNSRPSAGQQRLQFQSDDGGQKSAFARDFDRCIERDNRIAQFYAYHYHPSGQPKPTVQELDSAVQAAGLELERRKFKARLNTLLTTLKRPSDNDSLKLVLADICEDLKEFSSECSKQEADELRAKLTALETDVDAKSKRIRKLENTNEAKAKQTAENEDASAKLKTAFEKIEQLRGQRNKFQSELSTANNERDRIARQLRQTEEKVSSMETEIQGKDSEIRKTEVENAELAKQIDDNRTKEDLWIKGRKEVRDAKALIKQQEASLEEKQQSVVDLQSEVTRIEQDKTAVVGKLLQRNDELTAEIRDKSERIGHLESEEARQSDRIDELEEKQKGYRSGRTKADKRIKELEANEKTQSTKISQFEKRIVELKRQEAESQKRTSALGSKTKEVDDLTERVHQLADTGREQRQRIADLVLDITGKAIESGYRTDELKEKRKRITELETKERSIPALESRIEKLQANEKSASKLEGRIQQLTTSQKHKSDRITELEEESLRKAHAWDESKAKMQGRIDQLVLADRDQVAEIESLQGTITANKQQSEETVSSLDVLIEQLRSDVSEKAKQVELMGTSHAAAEKAFEEKLQGLEESEKAKSDRIAELEGINHAHITNQSTAKEATDKLKHRVDELEGERSGLNDKKQNLEARVIELESAIATLKGNETSSRKLLDEYNTRFEELEGKQSELSGEKRRLETRVSELEEADELHRGNDTKSKKLLDERNSRINDLEGRQQELEDEKRKLETCVSELKAANEIQKGNDSNAKKLANQQNTRIKELQGSKGELEAQEKQLRKRIAELKLSEDEKAQQISGLLQERKVQSTKNEKLTAEIYQVRVSNQGLEQELEQRDTLLGDCQERVGELEKENDKLKDAERSAKTARDRNAFLESARTSFYDRAKSAEAKLEQSAKDVVNLHANHTEATNKLTKLQAAWAGVQSENGRLLERIQQLVESAQRTSGKNHYLVQSMHRRLDRSQARLNVLKQRDLAMQQQKASLRRQSVQLRATMTRRNQLLAGDAKALQDQVSAMSLQHKEELSRTVGAASLAMEKLQTEHEEAMAHMEGGYEDSIGERDTKHASEVVELQSAVDRAVEKLQIREEELEGALTANSNAIADLESDLQREFVDETDKLKREHLKALSDKQSCFEGEVEGLNSQLELLELDNGALRSENTKYEAAMDTLGATLEAIEQTEKAVIRGMAEMEDRLANRDDYIDQFGATMEATIKDICQAATVDCQRALSMVQKRDERINALEKLLGLTDA